MNCFPQCSDEEKYSSNESSLLRPKRARQESAGPSGVSDKLAELFQKASVQERELAYDEVHGVVSHQKFLERETPQFVSSKMLELKASLRDLHFRKRKCYARAIFLQPSLENDEKFHLLFLRATGYDPDMAAICLCGHFTDKLALWGDEKLGKRILLDDLSEDDLLCLRAGGSQFLKKGDSVGLLLFLFQAKRIQFRHWRNFARVLWYQVMSRLLDDHGLHANGIVNVYNATGLQRSQIPLLQQVLTHVQPLLKNLPRRNCGFHIIYDNPIIQKVWQSTIRFSPSRKASLRIRVHFASPLEASYWLMTFGIKIDEMVLSGEENDASSSMESFIEERQELEKVFKVEEEGEAAKGMISYPGPADVLFGRGKQSYDAPGNRLLRQYIDELSVEYSKADERLAKTALVMMIISRVRENGGRFVERKTDHWILAGEDITKRKVAREFRAQIQGKGGANASF